jgi:hypothetical protein
MQVGLDQLTQLRDHARHLKGEFFVHELVRLTLDQLDGVREKNLLSEKTSEKQETQDV